MELTLIILAVGAALVLLARRREQEDHRQHDLANTEYEEADHDLSGVAWKLNFETMTAQRRVWRFNGDDIKHQFKLRRVGSSRWEVRRVGGETWEPLSDSVAPNVETDYQRFVSQFKG